MEPKQREQKGWRDGGREGGSGEGKRGGSVGLKGVDRKTWDLEIPEQRR